MKMAQLKAATQVDEYTLEDKLDEMRSKFHLKEKASEAYRENCNLEVENNATSIKRYRRDNLEHRYKLQDLIHRDRKVIRKAFRDSKRPRLALQRLLAQDAVDVLEKQGHEVSKRLDKVRCANRKKLRKIDELKRDLSYWEAVGQRLESGSLKPTVARLENALDKAKMKYRESLHIREIFEGIIEQFKNDNLLWPFRIRALDEMLTYQEDQLLDLQDIQADASNSKDVTDRNLNEVIVQTQKDKKIRKKEVGLLRKTADLTKKSIDRKQVPPTFTGVSQEQKMREEHIFKSKLKKAFRLEKNFKMILEVTQSQDLRGVIEWYRSRKEALQSLETDCAMLEKTIEVCQEQIGELQEDYDKAVYSDEAARSKNTSETKKLEEEIATEEKLSEDSEKQFGRSKNYLMDVVNGLSSLLEKLQDVKVRETSPPLAKDIESGAVQLVDLCEQKIDKMMEDLNIVVPSAGLRQRLENLKFQQYLEEQRTAKCGVVDTGEASMSSISLLDYDDSVNSQVPDRKTMKYRAELLVKAKLKAKKKAQEGK